MGPGGGNTRTGKTFEDVIKAALISNGYGVCEQIVIGKSLFGGNYKADFVVSDPLPGTNKCIMSNPGKIIISCKWQQVPGTAEQKLLYEIASLIKIIKESNGAYSKAYVALGGPGFSAHTKKYLLSQRHREILKDGELVEVLYIDDMIAKINSHRL